MGRFSGVLATLVGAGCFERPPPPRGVAYVGPVSAYDASGNATELMTGPIPAHHAGDAALIQITCNAATQPILSLVATGWKQYVITLATDNPPLRGYVFGAIAEDDQPTPFAVTATTPCGIAALLGDVFSGNDPSGDATFDAQATATGNGDCTTALATRSDGDAVWAACTTAGHVTTVSSGWQLASDDGAGDLSGYTLGPVAGRSNVPVTFGVDDPQAAYLVAEVAIRP